MSKIKLEGEEKAELIKYLDGAITHLETQIEPLRKQLKFYIGEKIKLQKIRKCIK